MSQSKKIYLTIFLFSSLSLCLIFFLILPLLREIKESARLLISEKEKIISLKERVEKLKEFESFHQDLDKNLEKVNKLFIQPEVPIGFIEFLEKTAKDCKAKITISSFSFSKKKKENWQPISFQIKIKALPQDCLRFLEKIENSPYLIKIQNLNMKKIKTEKETSSKEIEANFSIEVYSK